MHLKTSLSAIAVLAVSLAGAGVWVSAERPEPAGSVALAEPVLPDEEAYARADWPEHNTALYAKDLQGKKLPVALGDEEWLTPRTDIKGRVLLLDFWATWCRPCIAAEPKLAKLQKANPEHLAVVGVSGQGEDAAAVREFLKEHAPGYPHLHDDQQRVFKPFESKGIPLVVVVSTDGVIRYMGNPHSLSFEKAVAQVLRVDPLIRQKSGG